MMPPALPHRFCWSRFGTEAGEPIERILQRKELERQRSGGIFLWGIGNALGPSMRALLQTESAPEVVFSPIASPPKTSDVSPPAIVAWASAADLDGAPVALPQWSIVTSRAPSPARAPRHYALVCFSSEPLTLRAHHHTVGIGSVRNILTGSKVGASQVTAVVTQVGDSSTAGLSYPVALRAHLVAPHFVALSDPRLLHQRTDGIPIARRTTAA